jgi:hypothetical protein
METVVSLMYGGQRRSVDVPVPEAPQTIRQNWIPFLTFFFLRVLSIYNIVSGGA